MADEELLIPLYPAGGMNQDAGLLSPSKGSEGRSDFEALGDYRYALNARIGSTSGNNDGALENMWSTLEITEYQRWNGSAWTAVSAPSGNNTCISKPYEDHKERKLYWAVYNSNGSHTILMYQKSTRQIFELLLWSGLNFSLDNFVSITKIDKYLIFTDGNPTANTGNPPRIIDVTSIYTLKSTLGNSFSEFHISLIKWAPIKPPLVTMGATATNDFLTKGIFQFAYRYIYVGGFASCWSPPSNFVSNQFLFKVNSDISHGVQPSPLIGDPVTFNIVANGWLFDSNNPSNTSFQHSDIRFYSFVDSIEYAYRQSTIDTWKSFAKVALNGAAPASVVFDNSGPTRTISDTEIGQYFDSVPLLSASLEAIDNRIMLANNKDQFQPISNLDITNIEVYSIESTDPNWFNVSGLSSYFPIQRFSFKEKGIYKCGILFSDEAGRTGLVQTLDKWSYLIPDFNPTTDANPTAQERYHALGFKIPNSVTPPDWAVSYQIVRSNCLNIDYFVLGIVNYIKFLNLNTGFADGSLQTDSEIRDIISGYYDNFNSGSGAEYDLVSRILAQIRKNDLAPDSHNCTLIYFDISNFYLDSTKSSLSTPWPCNNVFYSWQPGDRVRFWGSTDSTDTTYNRFDAEIITFTGTGIIVAKPETLYTLKNRTQSSTTKSRQFSIEIYRPKKFALEGKINTGVLGGNTQVVALQSGTVVSNSVINIEDSNVLFYEMGEWYPIIKPKTANRDFAKRDFTWTNLASVSPSTLNGFTFYNKLPITNGDVWIVAKNFFYSQRLLDEGYGGSGYPWKGFIGSITIPPTLSEYPQFVQMNVDRAKAASTPWEHNTGRPFVAYQNVPTQFVIGTQIRFGGKFIENSLFINLNNFQDQDQKIFPSEYGKIRAMVNVSNIQVKSMGNILLVIGESETWSVYINRATLQNIAGDTQVTLSDQVLGAYNTLIGSHGTLNPESVSKRNSRVMFWNAKKGGWIRYSDDGLTAISEEGMSIWYNQLIEMLIDTYDSDTPATAKSVYDAYYDEWICFNDHSSLPDNFRGYDDYKCIAFSERPMDKRWKSVYSYAPDAFAGLDNETYSIIGAVVHIHEQGDDFGSFYGLKKDTMWQPVANRYLRTMKIWQALNIQATDGWSAPLIESDFKTNGQINQQTRLLLTDFKNLEGTLWADIKRDIWTINPPDQPTSIVNGNVMRSRALSLLVKLDPDVNWYSWLNCLVVRWAISEKTVKK